MQDPFSKFHIALAHTHRLMWSSPTLVPKDEFRVRYHNFMVTCDPDIDGSTLQVLGAWTTVTTELLLREEVE